MITNAVCYLYAYTIAATWLLAGGFALVAWKTKEPPPRWWATLVSVPALVSLLLGVVVVALVNR